VTRAFVLCGLAAAFVLPLPAQAWAPAYVAPKNGFGQPDLSGNWTNATMTPQVRSPLYGARARHTPEEVRLLETANAEKDAAAGATSDASAGAGGESDNVGAYDRAWIDNGVGVMRVGGEPRTSLITTPDGQPPVRKGESPRTLMADAGSVEAGRKAVKQAAAVDIFEGQGSQLAARMGAYDNPEQRALGERCILSFGRNGGPPMFPNGWYNNNYTLAQGRDAVAIVVEMVHDTRVVRLNAKHRTDGVRPWFGDSVGWYEGDTLVVETTHIPKAQAYHGAWEQLRVTERFTRVAKDRMRYRFTVEDPGVWAAPWGGEYEFNTLKGQVHEYACHEGNYALPGILAGAREEEKRAAVAGKNSGGGN